MAKKQPKAPYIAPPPPKPPTLPEQIAIERILLEVEIEAAERQAQRAIQWMRSGLDSIDRILAEKHSFGVSEAANLGRHSADLAGALAELDARRKALEGVQRVAQKAGMPWPVREEGESVHALGRKMVAEEPAEGAPPPQKEASQ